jgi:uncharacterized Zn finger protein
MSYGEWQPYVSVAQRRAKAAREMKKLRSSGASVEPIEIRGRKIAHTFWGEAWCKHLEQFSDFANRLPRGRTYARNGSVCHLAIKKGKVEAIVSGSELYEVAIDIAPLSSADWKNLRKQCAGQIGSMLELLQGRLSNQVMEIVTNPAGGLFPRPGDIGLHCSCPDWAEMCKHVAAVLYGIGARLDEKPELLFVLRKVDHEELISEELDIKTAIAGQGKRRRLADQDLSGMFGIDIEDSTTPTKEKKTSHRSNTGKSTRKNAASRSGLSGGVKVRVTPAEQTFTPTGKAVTRLRKHLRMTRSQFADLLDISPQTVTNWETRPGKLKLQARTLETLTRAWSRK